MIILLLCLMAQSSPLSQTAQVAQWAPHKMEGNYYRLEDFDLDHAVEEFVMESTLGPTTKGYTLRELRRALPHDVAVDASLLQELNYQYTKIATASLNASPSGWRWLIWLRHSNHSQVRVAAEKALRKKFLCEGCQGTGRCVKFLAGTGKNAETCLTCGWGPYSHDEVWFTDSMLCKWCDARGVFGKGRRE